MSMRIKLTNKILVYLLITLAIGLAGLYAFRLQGRQRSLNLRAATAEVVEIRLRVADTSVRLFRRADEWRLSHPALSVSVMADEAAVETLLDDLRHWEVKTLVPAEDFETAADTVSTPVSGRLRVYTQGRWGGLFGHRKVWDGRFRRSDRALYLRDSRRLYSRLYDPRRAGEGGEAALAADCTTALRHWRDRWISHYYYYDIARAEWQSADGRRFVYTPPTAAAGTTPADRPFHPQPAEGAASPSGSPEAALSAFRGVRFDRYAEPADSAALATALNAPPAAVFSVVSTAGDSTRLTAYTLYDTAGRADWFRLCGILDRHTVPAAVKGHRPAAPLRTRDTVFLNYPPLDRLRAALATYPLNEP